MLELLILLPFIMMTILSMTFQVSVDELYNASRGNYFKYSAPEIDHHYHHSGREKIIYLNRIITKLGEEMIVPAFLSLDYGCSCALRKEDCSSNQVFNPTTCRCENQPSERAEDTRKASDTIGCNCICPLHISQIYLTDPFFHPESHQYAPSDSFSGSRNRRPPV